jgi:serine/threonine protein phosphatase 1
MATYIMSDIHGHFDRYKEFLQYSNLGDNDILYIIGDVLDRGSEAIPLIQDIMQRNNVIMIKGNHEQMLLPILNDLMYQNKETQEQIINDEMAIAQIGQEDTLRDFCKLGSHEQNQIINFISQLPIYEELEVNGINYILVHGGLPNFSDMPLEYYDENELLFGPHDFFINHYGNDTIIIVGHLPTKFIDGATPHDIYHINDTIAIDCGCGFGGKLGVLCLDTSEELYF